MASKKDQAIKYIIAVWDETQGDEWRKNPDHVQYVFLEAEKEMKAVPKCKECGDTGYRINKKTSEREECFCKYF